MVTVRIHCVGHSYITLAIIGYHSNGVGIVFFDSIDELAFVKCYGVVVVAVRIHCVRYTYITLAIILNGSNGVSIILLYKITQLIAVDINLISMVAIYAFIGDFQQIGGSCYSCYGVGINNIFQLISYPATGCYIFYNCIYALTIGIINF